MKISRWFIGYPTNPQQYCACLDMRADTHSGKHMIHRMKLTIGQSALTMHRLILSPSFLRAFLILRAFLFVLSSSSSSFVSRVPRFHLPFLHDCPVRRWHGLWPRMLISDIAREKKKDWFARKYIGENQLFFDSITCDLCYSFDVRFK